MNTVNPFFVDYVSDVGLRCCRFVQEFRCFNVPRFLVEVVLIGMDMLVRSVFMDGEIGEFLFQ